MQVCANILIPTSVPLLGYAIRITQQVGIILLQIQRAGAVELVVFVFWEGSWGFNVPSPFTLSTAWLLFYSAANVLPLFPLSELDI
jgi:hypothetical protein